MKDKINLENIRKSKTLKELLEFSIINLDKPASPTSFQTAEQVGKILQELGVNKFCHFGTLDPEVTGVLPIGLNRACKLSEWFMKKIKTYVGIMKLHKEISRDKLEEEMKKFLGKIMQLPPVKSRVKREIREREVYRWKIIEFDKENKQVLFEAEVQAGTYIRKLISDLGEKIGGAHMAELRRIQAGVFKENDKSFCNLYELEKAVEEAKNGNEQSLKELIVPAEIIGEILPVIQVKEELIPKLLNGRPLFKEDFDFEIKEDLFCLFSGERFIGVYKKVTEDGVLARVEFVMN